MTLKALTQRVCGYTAEERKTVYVINTEGERAVKEETCICKEVAPDLTAILFVLTNLDAKQWRMKPDENGSYPTEEPVSGPDLTRLSEHALRELEELCNPS